MKLGDYIEFNPKVSLKKNYLYRYVSMQDLKPFTRSIKSEETSAYTGGSKFKNGDTLFARITPCLENGKTAFVNFLSDNEVGFGSTEFIVCRAENSISLPLFVYYLLCSERIRRIAIGSMTGTSGRERVQEIVLKETIVPEYTIEQQRHIVDTVEHKL